MTVWIVGAGPGDAELMAIKAARVLGEADAVVHDRLIGDDVLGYVSPVAQRFDVGKCPGRPGPTQDEINDLLIDLGRRYETVVRVKGGDPFVFGRGIEEVRACAFAGVDVEVVAGITSALAGPLAAGISVTERGVSSGVCIVTAHQDTASAPLDWAALVRTGLTIVVMMGATRAATIRDELINHGLDPTTPAAVSTSATHPDQRTWHGRLEDLGREPVVAPSVLVIGPAAGEGHAAVVRSSGTRRARLDTSNVVFPVPSFPIPERV